MDEDMHLGGNIQLSGFSAIEPSKLIVIKKIVGNYVKKFSELVEIESLKVHLKEIHGSRYEIKTNLSTNGKPLTAELTGENLFYTLDNTFKKLETQLKSLT
ncbi:MAG: HPF/RaiA family ribosome-associated protein [Nanobdellota archaeon]